MRLEVTKTVSVESIKGGSSFLFEAEAASARIEELMFNWQKNQRHYQDRYGLEVREIGAGPVMLWLIRKNSTSNSVTIECIRQENKRLSRKTEDYCYQKDMGWTIKYDNLELDSVLNLSKLTAEELHNAIYKLSRNFLPHEEINYEYAVQLSTDKTRYTVTRDTFYLTSMRHATHVSQATWWRMTWEETREKMCDLFEIYSTLPNHEDYQEFRQSLNLLIADLDRIYQLEKNQKLNILYNYMREVDLQLSLAGITGVLKKAAADKELNRHTNFSLFQLPKVRGKTKIVTAIQGVAHEAAAKSEPFIAGILSLTSLKIFSSDIKTLILFFAFGEYVKIDKIKSVVKTAQEISERKSNIRATL